MAVESEAGLASLIFTAQIADDNRLWFGAVAIDGRRKTVTSKVQALTYLFWVATRFINRAAKRYFIQAIVVTTALALPAYKFERLDK